VYSLDGRVKTIAKSELSSWLSVGWYASSNVTMYSPSGEKTTVHLWDVDIMKKNGWYTEPVYYITNSSGNAVLYTLSKIQKGAKVSLESALKKASNYGKTYMPLSQSDLDVYMYIYDYSAEYISEYLYQPTIYDFSDNAYLIGLDYLDAVLFVRIDKKTGEARYCGGGQNYYHGMINF